MTHLKNLTSNLKRFNITFEEVNGSVQINTKPFLIKVIFKKSQILIETRILRWNQVTDLSI